MSAVWRLIIGKEMTSSAAISWFVNRWARNVSISDSRPVTRAAMLCDGMAAAAFRTHNA